MTDPTDKVIDPEDWEPHGIICFKVEWIRRGLENICLCPAYKKEREAVCGGSSEV